MGLDLFDLSLRFEKELGVPIGINDWQQMTSGRDVRVGDLFNFLKQKLLLGQLGCLHGANLFLGMRSLVRKVLANDDLEILPKTSVAAAVPPYQRQLLWAELRQYGLHQLPALERPPWVRYPLGEIVLAIVCCGLTAAIANPWASPLLAGAVGIAIGLCLALTKPFQVVPPAGAQTFGQVAAMYVPTKGALLSDKVLSDKVLSDERLSDEQLEEFMRQTIVETIGCDAGEVTLDKGLVKDLGMD